MKTTGVKRRKSGREIVVGQSFHRVSEISKICRKISHGTKPTFGEYSTGGAMKNRGLAIVPIAIDAVDFETADMVSMMRS